MIEWLKTKAILILGITLALSISANVVFSFVVFKNGLKITRNEYITNTSTSNSYASSGALNMNIIGQQQYWNGKFELKRKFFENYADAFEFAKSFNICDFELAKIVVAGNGVVIWYQEFVTQTDKKEEIPQKTYTEKLNQ